MAVTAQLISAFVSVFATQIDSIQSLNPKTGFQFILLAKLPTGHDKHIFPIKFQANPRIGEHMVWKQWLHPNKTEKNC